MEAGIRGGIRYPLGSPEVVRDSGVALLPTSKVSIDPSRLDRPVDTVPGVGKATGERLRALGIHSVGELLMHLPFRHEQPSRLTDICDLRPGEEVSLRVEVVSCAVRETSRRRVKVLEALVSDRSGSTLAAWYNQPYLEAPFKKRPQVLLRGSLVRRAGGSTFVVKRHEILGDSEESHHILGLIPVYPSTGDLSVRTIRTLLHRAAPELRHIIDPLPADLLARRRYPGKAESIWVCHFPSAVGEAQVSRDRLAFEELLLLQLALLRQRAANETARKARALAPPSGLSTRFLRGLPYELTAAQVRAVGEIEGDLRREHPMRRLLHGDVGSGKTVVAAYCLLRAVEQGAQAALMAPTEVLADQHYMTLSEQLHPLGVKVGLLKGSQTAGERRSVREALDRGELSVAIGTHALIQEGVRFKDLRVAIVDEQHRFGVGQRDAILAMDAKGYWPHTLHMSATPIPRTLSLTLYGDLDISVLDEMPAGRQPVETRLIAADAEHKMWATVRDLLDCGHQAYVVCPLIEESETLQTASARQTFADLCAGELEGYEVRLLHGQLGAQEKASAMADFVSGTAQVLVSTSVIEVGVDVANAVAMVIMGARRFGLSQLHQLRGRVGRGEARSLCFLLADGEEGEASERLALFARTPDGFDLAEADLLARGAGQLFGSRQSGLGDLQVASLTRDRHLLEQARAEALKVIHRSGTAGSRADALLLEAAAAGFAGKMSWMERV